MVSNCQLFQAVGLGLGKWSGVLIGGGFKNQDQEKWKESLGWQKVERKTVQPNVKNTDRFLARFLVYCTPLHYGYPYTDK